DEQVALGRYQGVGVGTAGGLHGRDVARVGLVADVEDLDALPRGLLGRGLARARAGAVRARGVGGQDQQVPGDRYVVLGSGAQDLADHFGAGGTADVPDDEAVVVAREGVSALERQVGVESPEGLLGYVDQ